MSKVTVITDATGKIVAIGHGHLSEQSARKSGVQTFQAGLRAGPGQHLHEIEVPGSLEHVKTWTELHEKVQPHLKQP